VIDGGGRGEVCRVAELRRWSRVLETESGHSRRGVLTECEHRICLGLGVGFDGVDVTGDIFRLLEMFAGNYPCASQ